MAFANSLRRAPASSRSPTCLIPCPRTTNTSSRCTPRRPTSSTSCRSKAATRTSLVRRLSLGHLSSPGIQLTSSFIAFPWVAGAEFAGVVISTPKNSKNPRYPVGARVFGASQGAFATKLCSAENGLLPVPKGWSFQDAAGLFVTAPTSYGALVVRAEIKKGDYVLVHAAAGGVGLAAVQGK